MGIDFNPTFFYHEKAAKLTLSSPDEEIRHFGFDTGRHVSAFPGILQKNWQSCDEHLDSGRLRRYSARRPGPGGTCFKDSLDQILSIPYDRSSKGLCVPRVQGIWHRPESYTFGSSQLWLELARRKRYYQLDEQ
ncbi:MAG: L-rhamnose isomerase [Gallintestinimicrobium sp.]